MLRSDKAPFNKNDLAMLRRSARLYNERLLGKEITFIHREHGGYSKITVHFKAEHFAHLAGICAKTGVFYPTKKVFNQLVNGAVDTHKLAYTHNRRLFHMKNKMFPKIARINTLGRKLGQYDPHSNVRLSADYVVAADHACISFKKTNGGYVPISILDMNIVHLVKPDSLRSILATAKAPRGIAPTAPVFIRDVSKKTKEAIKGMLAAIVKPSGQDSHIVERDGKEYVRISAPASSYNKKQKCVILPKGFSLDENDYSGWKLDAPGAEKIGFGDDAIVIFEHPADDWVLIREPGNIQTNDADVCYIESVKVACALDTAREKNFQQTMSQLKKPQKDFANRSGQKAMPQQKVAR